MAVRGASGGFPVVVAAPDSFKGSLTASDAAAAMERGVKMAWPEAMVVKAPMADGGEGTIDCIRAAIGGEKRRLSTVDPLGRPRPAEWLVLPDRETVVIEIAAASGLTLIPAGQRRAAVASSYGSGLQIRQALDAGFRRFVVALGGSATNDAGTGLLTGLGMRWLDGNGRELPPGGLALERLQTIDDSNIDRRLARCQFLVAADVRAPLCGVDGTSHLYARQKGASDEEIDRLDRALAHFAELAACHTGRQVGDIPGAGAAGGTAAGLLAFTNAELRPGFDLLAEITGLPAKIAAAGLVLTGEGQSDRQTMQGKVPLGVCRLASSYGKPVLLFSGQLAKGYEGLYRHGLTAAFAISRQLAGDRQYRLAGKFLADTVADALRLYRRAMTAQTGPG
ncbi:MAG: glycerate kinase [Negativicutes bacterium]|nr:glycerate kinase [Negativicutes bacterium]